MAALTHDIVAFRANHGILHSVRPLHRLISRAAATVGLWRLRLQERRALGSMCERELQDLRLSRWDAEREMMKPFWRG